MGPKYISIFAGHTAENGAAIHNWQYNKNHKMLMVLSPAGRQDFSVLK
jgi:hypothetical protein